MIGVILLLGIAVLAYLWLSPGTVSADDPPARNEETPLDWNEIYDRHVRLEVMQREVAQRCQQQLDEAWQRYSQGEEREW